jgi:hypothetical protein
MLESVDKIPVALALYTSGQLQSFPWNSARLQHLGHPYFECFNLHILYSAFHIFETRVIGIERSQQADVDPHRL